jgi:hypothetical protein
LLTRGEDYAFAQPSLTKKKKTRRLELQAGAPRWQCGRGVWSTNTKMRAAERELALQAQRAYERTIADWQAAAKAGAERDTGARITTTLKEPRRAADHKPLTSALRDVSHSRPPTMIAQEDLPHKPT